MKNLTLVPFLVSKYLRGSISHLTLKIMGIIACCSIGITTFTLSLQLFITQGFEHALTDKMQNIYPDLVITAPENHSFNFSKIKKTLTNNYPSIAHCAPGHTKIALLKTSHPLSQAIVTIKAVDPLLEPLVSNIQTKLTIPNSLQNALEEKGIVMGKILAENNNIKIGDHITLLIPEDDSETEEDFSSFSFKVTGFLETGIYHYDTSLVLCTLKTMQDYLLDPSISTVSVKLTTKKDTLSLLTKIQEKHHWQVDCWQTLYPALVAASQLEKYVGILLLGLMSLVACTTITGFIFMLITLKKRDIALLKMRGFTHSTIVIVFMSIGMIITSIACILGLGGALIAALFLQHYKCFSLPEVYDVTHIPICITPSALVFIISLILILGFLATLLATYNIRTINISYTFRFDE